MMKHAINQYRLSLPIALALLLPLALVTTILRVSAFSAAGWAGPQLKRQVPILATGDYLRGDYLAALRRTRSPVKSDVGGPQLIRVLNSAEGTTVQLIFNFHEGGEEYTIGKDGSEQMHAAMEHSPKSPVTVVDSHHLQVRNAPTQVATYTFVGEAERYVAAVVLAGRYSDDQGRTYLFGKDGWATFPDRKFKYIIGLDHVFENFDYFWDDSSPSPTTFAFKWTGGRLQMFKVSGDFPDEVVDRKPLAVLHEVSSQ